MARAVFLWSLAICHSAVWLALIGWWGDNDEPGTWVALLLTIPAIATGLVGLLARQSHRAIALTARGSAVIAGGIMLAVYVYLASTDAFH